MKNKFISLTVTFLLIFLIIQGLNIKISDLNTVMMQINSENSKGENHSPITKAENSYKIKVVGDGKTYDSKNIQNSINKGVALGYKSFKLPPNVICLIDSTIKLSSDIIIDGQGATLKSKSYNDVGKYTTCIFTSNNTSNIAFKNINFNGNTGSTGYIDTTYNTKISNLLKFDTVTNLKFENCKFTRFLSNINTSITDKFKSGYWALMFIKSCKNIKLIDCELTGSAIEGWLFWECEDVLVQRGECNNKYMSTPISFWFCNGVKLLNSKIMEDVNRKKNAGSVLNIYSKNVLIDGCNIIGGTSIDIGNEIEYPKIPFIQENLTISNCYIKTMINSIYDDKTKHLNKNVRIFNNIIDATGFSYGIKTGNTDTANIYNNIIIGAVNGIRILKDNYLNVKIYNNTIRDVDRGINISIENNTIKNIDIYDNKCITQEVKSITDDGSFIVFNNTQYSLGTEIIRNIKIRNNNVKCPIAWVWVVNAYTNKPYIENMLIQGNNFDALNGGSCSRAVTLSYVKKAIIKDNTFSHIGVGGNKFSNTHAITIENNKY